METINELFKNPAITGLLGACLGLLASLATVIINRKTAIDMKARDEAFQRLKLAIDAGLEDHRYRSDLATKRADKSGSTATIYPSVFSILYSLKMHDLIRDNLTDAKLESELLRIQKEMKAMQKNYEEAAKK